MIYSCNYDDSFEPEPKQVFPVSNITLGKKLENPYSVKNMRKAYENIKAQNLKNRTSSENVDIVATHLYVKFIPKTENELDIVKRDSTLVLYDYPLDYEIGKGDVYRDPNVPKSQPTPQYCAVDINYQFTSEVEYEIIEELYIPDEDSDENKASRSLGLSQNFIDQLVDEALIITGNLDEEASKNSINARRTSWRPAGTIKVWDDSLGTSRRVIEYKTSKSYDYSTCGRGGLPCPTVTTTRVPVYGTMTGSYQPLEGVEVRARRWFTTHRGIANSSGYYTCDGTFKRPANYSIDWERYDYSIRSGSIGQAKMDGPKRRGNWNVDIRDNDIQQFYAFIHLGAHHYYYGNILGLSRPPLNSFWKPQMKIGGFNKDGRADHSDDRRLLGIRNQVRMYRIEGGNIADSERLYNTTLHELAHASHWEFRKGNWDNGRTEDKLQESWAMGIAWSLTRLRYPNHNWWANVDFNWMTSPSPRGDNQYTPLIIDLMDNTNQGLTDKDNRRPFDRVSGYTIVQIEAVISNSSNIQNLRDNLRNRYPNNATRGFLDELFEQYINLSR